MYTFHLASAIDESLVVHRGALLKARGIVLHRSALDQLFRFYFERGDRRTEIAGETGVSIEMPTPSHYFKKVT